MTNRKNALRTVLEKTALSNAEVDEIVASLAPAIAAIEAELGAVDLMLALITVQADSWLRQRERGAGQPLLAAGGRR